MAVGSVAHIRPLVPHRPAHRIPSSCSVALRRRRVLLRLPERRRRVGHRLVLLLRVASVVGLRLAAGHRLRVVRVGHRLAVALLRRPLVVLLLRWQLAGAVHPVLLRGRLQRPRQPRVAHRPRALAVVHFDPFRVEERADRVCGAEVAALARGEAAREEILDGPLIGHGVAVPGLPLVPVPSPPTSPSEAAAAALAKSASAAASRAAARAEEAVVDLRRVPLREHGARHVDAAQQRA